MLEEDGEDGEEKDAGLNIDVNCSVVHYSGHAGKFK